MPIIMNTTNKQIKANRKNALKSTGPATPEGKAIASRNSLKHGLLAKEVVINDGEGAENQEQFNALLLDLKDHFEPQGSLEEILVEKIAASYWRLRRAHRFEVGLIRKEQDTATDDFYQEKTGYGNTNKNKTDAEIDAQIVQEKHDLESMEKGKSELIRLYKNNTPLSDIYDWYENWNLLYHHKVHYLVPEEVMDDDDKWTQQMKEHLNNEHGWTDDSIWQTHIDLCDDRIVYHKQQISDLQKEKEKNHLALQVQKKLTSIPEKHDLERLLKYEGSIDKQFYKAIDQLERLQRRRKGDFVPPPVNVDLNINKEEGS